MRAAVARGADALAMAGGDGSQAIVAAIAAEHDLPYACIPAGTRNHFALDLGVDRDDVVGALDAFVDGGERRVDLAEVNGRVFVNNVSLGLYAEAVQREGYRDAKLRTILDTVPDVLGPGAARAGPAAGPARTGSAQRSAAVILVSNNRYRLGRAVGSGTRPTHRRRPARDRGAPDPARAPTLRARPSPVAAVGGAELRGHGAATGADRRRRRGAHAGGAPSLCESSGSLACAHRRAAPRRVAVGCAA